MGTTTATKTAKKHLDKQATLLYVHHPFLYVSFPSLHDHALKSPNFYVCEGREHRKTISFSFLKFDSAFSI